MVRKVLRDDSSTQSELWARSRVDLWLHDIGSAESTTRSKQEERTVCDNFNRLLLTQEKRGYQPYLVDEKTVLMLQEIRAMDPRIAF
jgi:hypothetical protein